MLPEEVPLRMMSVSGDVLHHHLVIVDDDGYRRRDSININKQQRQPTTHTWARPMTLTQVAKLLASSEVRDPWHEVLRLHRRQVIQPPLAVVPSNTRPHTLRVQM